MLGHVIDADHVPVADQHVHAKVEDLCVDLEVLGNAFVDSRTPLHICAMG